MAFRVKRIYDAAELSDGRRYLVDGLWPRGISRAAASIDGWLKELAPSGELRRWYGHDPARWLEFKRRYFRELLALQASWEPLLTEARRGPVTLLFSARDERHNQAVALGEFLRRRSRRIRHK
jgi:uncharacterized protein YeaO (DUF488 family)